MLPRLDFLIAVDSRFPQTNDPQTAFGFQPQEHLWRLSETMKSHPHASAVLDGPANADASRSAAAFRRPAQQGCTPVDWPLAKSFTAPTASSDEELSAGILRQLRHSGYMPLRKICISVDHGRVQLRGRVPSYYLKQLAQATALSIEGVEHVDNRLVVE